MTRSTSADRAVVWYADGRAPNGPVQAGRRPRSAGPRALEARGLSTMHHVLVQLADVGLRPRFAESCKAYGDIVWCDDLDELVARADSRSALAVVVDVTDRWGRSSATSVAAIRAERPDLPIVLWADRQVAPSRLVSDVATAGASAIVFRDGSDLEQRLLSALTRATDVAFHQLTDQALSRRVPEPLIPVFRFLLDRADAMPSADVLAASADLTARRLRQELRRAGMPALSVLMSWSRVLTAAYRLEKTTESVGDIARSVGFASASTLSRLLKRYTNELPRGLRGPGGFGWVLRCFERRLSRRR